MFWTLIFAMGLLGTVGDVAISHWSKTSSPYAWALGAIGYLAFMGTFGYVLRAGAGRYPLSVALCIALVLNIALVTGWDVLYTGTSVNLLQKMGIMLAVGAVVCIELGGK